MLNHVGAQQDDKKSFDELPFYAQLNVHCNNKMTAVQLKRQLLFRERALVSVKFIDAPQANLYVEVSIRN